MNYVLFTPPKDSRSVTRGDVVSVPRQIVDDVAVRFPEQHCHYFYRLALMPGLRIGPHSTYSSCNL